MRDDDSNWFSKWEDDLPSPQDLMPLSQTLITPDLAIAFNIQPPITHHTPSPNPTPNSAEFDSPELGSTGGDEPARTLKRPRLVWTPQLHKRFVDAVAHLGIKNAVPKTIMQLMSVDGLTRENVASHLQKYRLYLKRMQGLGNGSGSGNDPVTDRLFASSPVPAHFFVPVGGQLQPRGYGQMGQFGLAGNGQFVNRQNQQGVVRVGTAGYNSVLGSAYGDDLESANGRKVLTLFPNGDD